jgi:hypothetical protein
LNWDLEVVIKEDRLSSQGQKKGFLQPIPLQLVI